MGHGALEKTETLSAVYQYVANRLESVDQRSSVLMVLSGSFLSYVLTTQHIAIGNGADTLLEIALRPSILLGAASFLAFYMSQFVRIRRQTDLISLIVFSHDDLAALTERFRNATGEQMLEEVISNQRVVGEILMKKGRYYNIGALLLALAAICHALQK